MRHSIYSSLHATAILCCSCLTTCAVAADPDEGYHTSGPLAGTLKSPAPAAIYDADPNHIWNRLFNALYVRKSNLPNKPGGDPVARIEGGDYIDFLAWGGSAYWSSEPVLRRIDLLLDEFLSHSDDRLSRDALRRSVMLRDLWAAHDFLVDQNIRRVGSLATRNRRTAVATKLARAMRSLALSPTQIASLPDTYAAAVRSGQFAQRQDFESSNDYLPPGLLSRPEEWVEIDFFQPNIHEDLYDRFITLHARAYRGRSYFRIFYRFPGGRQQLVKYLNLLDAQGVDWRQAAQDGFILLKPDAPQVPVGTEVTLLQFMMTLDDKLRPTPTPIVESVRHRRFRNISGASEPHTNTGLGMHVMEYTLKRKLLFDDLQAGGLHREPDDRPLYLVIFQPPHAADWGTQGRKVLFQQCADCHLSPKANRLGVHSMPSIVHMGGFDAGAQLGIAKPLTPKQQNANVKGKRVARWKTQHETYRRLLESLGI
ncbi:MAG: hypothetical protein QGG36_01205 [Pirellulaceae bacterium]|jgi:hypothetical protein|nr:hypothetical protein [Pirellulaceae bacterium]MDP7014395.1 hypothetical protein [Pirellulaceae bacterium]